MVPENRREFLQAAAVNVAALSLSRCALGTAPSESPAVPSFLRSYEELYRQDSRAATLKWFQEARFGLFLHFGVYSLLGRGEWVQFHDKIPVAEYGKLKDRFQPDKFNADEICDLALAAGMKYINLTAKHHDSFCLFRTNWSDFTSLDAPCERDLFGELAQACAKKGLGLFFYYSYALDWRHPFFFSREAAGLGWEAARPDYPEPQPEYRYEKEEDFQQYLNFAHAQFQEALYRYESLAGVWLDPIMGYYSHPELFPVSFFYQLIREAQPQLLICFKQGANGEEDFIAPEKAPGVHPDGGELARLAWEKNQGKPIEICDKLQPASWGYDRRDEGKHRTVDDVLRMLERAGHHNANLLLNTGPLPDGSIHPDDVKTLLEVGKRL
jgi:alpha-L-fucosidase